MIKALTNLWWLAPTVVKGKWVVNTLWLLGRTAYEKEFFPLLSHMENHCLTILLEDLEHEFWNVLEEETQVGEGFTKSRALLQEYKSRAGGDLGGNAGAMSWELHVAETNPRRPIDEPKGLERKQGWGVFILCLTEGLILDQMCDSEVEAKNRADQFVSGLSLDTVCLVLESYLVEKKRFSSE